jgi:hypothetical protein
LRNNKNVLPNFFEIMSCAIEGTKLIDMKENKIDKISALEREYVNDIQDLEDALEEESLGFLLRRSLHPLRSHIMK